METFHILHLASCWAPEAQTATSVAPPLQHGATAPSIPPGPAVPSAQTIIPDAQAPSDGAGPSRIRAAAAQMVFAARTSQDFITPQKVVEIEAWTGRAVLEALIAFEIPNEVSRPSARSRVEWSLTMWRI